MPATSKSIQLSPRDRAMIRDIARYKFLSSFQLERLYFAEIKQGALGDSYAPYCSCRSRVNT